VPLTEANANAPGAAPILEKEGLDEGGSGTSSEPSRPQPTRP